MTICPQTAVTIGTSYGFAKGFMYSVMILRLQVAYGKSSEYSYSIYLLVSFLLYTFAVSLGLFLISFYRLGHAIYTYHGQYWCHTEIPFFVLAYIAINDVLMGSIMVYLFVSRLVRIHEYTRRVSVSSSSKSKSHVFKLAVKYSILTFFGTLTSFLSLILIGITNLDFFGVADAIVGGVCVTLMGKSFDHIYENQVCCLVLLFLRKYTRLMKDQDNMERSVTRAISSAQGSKSGVTMGTSEKLSVEMVNATE